MTQPMVFRCDGDSRLGAGHVARCLRIAAAFSFAGYPVRMVGRYSGIAARLVAAACIATEPSGAGPAGVPADADRVLVDSYEIDGSELSELAERMNVAVIWDRGNAPRVGAVVSYRPDAALLRVPSGTTAITGVDYAPVDATMLKARRPRSFSHALLTMGGSASTRGVFIEGIRALIARPELDVFVAGPAELPPELRSHPRVEAGLESGLRRRIQWADIAVSAAGTTAYDLACAGVPAVILAIAGNQHPFARALEAAGTALVASRGRDIPGQLARLADIELRDALAAAGPALLDGYGAFRVRDAVLDAFAGRPVRPPLRYRPACAADSAAIWHWRNEPASRAASRNTDPIRFHEHERWLSARLQRSREPLFIVEEHSLPIGYARFDRHGAEAQISVALDPQRRGTGLGSRVIAEACELVLAADPGLQSIAADVRSSNQPSRRAFARAGFGFEGEDEGWLRLRRRRVEPLLDREDRG